MEKPTLPKGTRDFGPTQMAKRQFILENIRKVFQKYGFQPLETPAMENLTTLTGKYGEEGDQLLFRILDSGDFVNDAQNLILKSKLRVLFQNLYDQVNFRLGPLKDRSVEDLRGEILKSLGEINYQEEYLLDAFKESVKSQLADVSLNLQKWLEQAKKEPADNALDAFAKFYKLRNKNIDDVLNLFLNNKNLLPIIAEKGLRYDLTVPFARYVVMNRHEITFPFKRYQIQPVWRADRPQKGRYREFYQCDADVVGTNSLICEAEIILMIKEVFKGLGISDYTIKINHRGILSGLAELCEAKEKETSLFVAIDKLDKIGEEKVKDELRERGFADASLTSLFEVLNFKGNTSEKIDFLRNKFEAIEIGKKGISDFKEVLNLLAGYSADDSHVEFDIALARGLSYYTGCIFEVKINNVSIGSVSGGGRYDNLTGVFGLPGVSGVGFSFGVDRLYDAMEELALFPQEAQVSTKVLIAYFDDESKRYGLNVINQLREKGIASEIYPDGVKIQKQLDYANKKMIPFTIVIGSEEIKTGVLAFKNMKTGEQRKLTIEGIINELTNN